MGVECRYAAQAHQALPSLPQAVRTSRLR